MKTLSPAHLIALLCTLFAVNVAYSQFPAFCNAPPYVTDLLNEVKLTSCLDANSSAFGEAIAFDGTNAYIGDPGEENGGVVYVFSVDASTGDWKLKHVLTGSDSSPGDAFGFSIALQGKKLVVGAPGVDEMGSNSGAAYVFLRTGGVWSEVVRLRHDSPESGDGFGAAVAIQDKWVIVSAPFDDIPVTNGINGGSVHTFKRIGSTYVPKEVKVLPYHNHAGEHFGEYLELDGDWLAVGSTQSGHNVRGRVNIYKYNGTRFEYQQNIGGTKFDRIGTHVNISGDFMAFGANWFWDGAEGELQIYQVDPVTGMWEPFQIIKSPDSDRPEENGYDDRFGYVNVLDGNRLITNTFRQKDGIFEMGGVFWYEFDGTAFVLKTKYITEDYTNSYFQFGKELAIHGDMMLAFGRYGAEMVHNRSAVYAVSMDKICMPPNTGLTYTVLPGGDVQFDWDASTSSDVVEYKLKLRSRFDNSFTELHETTATTYTIPAVPAGTDFIWDVRAICSDGEKSYRYEGPDFATPVLRTNGFAAARIFPNPVSGATLSIDVEDNYDQVAAEILTLSGQLISSQLFAQVDGRFQLAVDELPAGVYLLQLTLDGEQLFEKFVKE